jgi:hypothetical protein
MFDSLLLLQPGGTQVYCGPIGFRGATVRGESNSCQLDDVGQQLWSHLFRLFD